MGLKRKAMKPRKTHIARTAMKRKPRKAAETLRVNGPPERVEFVQALPCCWCGRIGATENAHTVTGGTGRKADAKEIAPLCGVDLTRDEIGCHKRYDQHLEPFDSDEPREHVKAAARETERLWLHHQHPDPEHISGPLGRVLASLLENDGDAA